jgi:hypothetical protein
MSKRSITQGHARRAAAVAATSSILLACASLAFAGTAAAADQPGWETDSRVLPTNIKPGGTGMIVDDVYNIGKGETTGTVTLTDILPPGLEVLQAGPMAPLGYISNETAEQYEAENEAEETLESEGRTTSGLMPLRAWECSGTTTVTCTTRPGYKGVLRPIRSGYLGRIGIFVKAVGPASVGANHVTVSGGGAPGTATASTPVSISSDTLSFGLNEFNGWFSNADGTIDTQAGSHPYSMTFGFNLNSVEHRPAGGGLRDVQRKLPPGVIGDPHAVPQCPRQQFLTALTGGCPPDTQVGVDYPGIDPEAEEAWGDFELRFAVYNLVPPPGVPAEFGFTAEGSNILIDAEVRSGGDYGITGALHNLAYNPVFNTITFWGVPADETHNRERCGIINTTFAVTCGWKPGASIPKPLLTVPTACEGAPKVDLSVDSWDSGLGTSQESMLLQSPTGRPLGFEGCEHLPFGPSLSVSPDTSFADTPAGLTVDVKVPQEGLSVASGVSTADIKNTTVTLPEGVVINPGQAAGLGACGPAEDALTTDAERAEGKEDKGPAHCPSSSRVGVDEIETPLLAKPLKGAVYVMPSNPPHLQLLVTAEGEGVFLKLVGDVNLDEKTGRLVTTFADTPGLPFTDFKLSFSGGAQAALSTPLQCGTYNTTSDFTPWSSPLGADAFPSSNFAIPAGTGGAACPPSPLPFTPSMIAGSTTDQAGGFTDFSLLLTRPDDQQRIQSLQFKTPEGLLGMISRVPLCPQQQANEGTCSSASQIGHTVVEAGPGPYPLVVPQPGQPPAPIYLTEGYRGAPYGLSIVVPLHVGPFTLQTQIVRARIEVDPITTQLTITTDPFPTIVDGIPADLRAINAVIDRPGFMFNPTGCSPRAFYGTAYGVEGAQASIGSHFQMGSCQALKFRPDFKVSTSGRTSRANGASLGVRIVYPVGNLGANQASSQSNIERVKVELPKRLPSRLTTLQKACTAAQFDANPAGCPAASVVGHATAVTPVLPVPLTGPAYFVSNGSEAFPNLIIVLQGYGVTVHLIGDTFISKAGITSSTFKQVPDVPIQSFELTLPQGPFSALAANGNLCKAKLKMPTDFVAQNGAVLDQSTPIAVTGCHKARKARKAGAKRIARKRAPRRR